MLFREDAHRLVRAVAVMALVVVVAHWDRKPPTQVEAAAAPAEERLHAAPPLSDGQRQWADEQCARKSGEEFRRGWGGATVDAAPQAEKAAFESHYNARLDVCFYELTLTRPAAERGGEATRERKMLFDLDERVLYGEYRGPVSGGSPQMALPDVCQLAGLYCASRREWDVLVEPLMEPSSSRPGAGGMGG